MNEPTWTTVDDYLGGLFLPPDSALDAALNASAAAHLPPIQVAPLQGKLLHLLASLQQAKYILEIGTLGGYSTIWLARALPPDGKLITLEYEPKHADIARANLDHAGLAARVDIRLGAALDTLPKLAAEHLPPFDLAFIDADKVNNAAYFDWALRLSRPGGLILVDNVVRNGAIVDPSSTDPAVVGTRQLLEHVSHEPRVTATVLQTVGNKGYDGLLLARINT